MQIVWFKRDLRVRDHSPLMEASVRGDVLPLYIVEPGMFTHPEFDPTHWTFIRESLIELRAMLARLGAPLVVRVGDAVDVFDSIREQHTIDAIWAHEETGNGWSFARDKHVRRWAKAHGIPLTEIPQTGAVRGLKDRDQWASIWDARMSIPIITIPSRLTATALEPGAIPHLIDLGMRPTLTVDLQPGGERRAWDTLETFLYQRAVNYPHSLSNPNLAYENCSRLSAYLAWGNLSTKQVVAVLRRRQNELASIPPEVDFPTERWRLALRMVEERLHWRDHFIQKLEREPRIEFENFVRAYDGLRDDNPNNPRLLAWREGMTGFPMIDACMRALNATHYLNFRMRAMLVSFASYDLWLHWREPSLHLARVYLDNEPGIHYSQMQMQSGTTGINAIRVYNPVKQAQTYDPDGTFIRRWLPELAAVPTSFIHLPHLMPGDMQRRCGVIIGTHYPAPIVDHESAARDAMAKIYAVRSRPETKIEAAYIQALHGSRRRPSERRRKRAARSDARQLRLF